MLRLVKALDDASYRMTLGPADLAIGFSQICSKFAQNAFGNFPKFLPIMLFILPIVLLLCSNMNNMDVKFLFFECSIRVLMI